MIRRFYILPVNPGVPEAKPQEMIDVLNAADRFIPGLLDSSTGIDFDSPTAAFVKEAMPLVQGGSRRLQRKEVCRANR